MDVNVCICLDCSYHLAEKKIPSVHGHTVGLKLEQFIFDAFPYAPSTALFEVIISPPFSCSNCFFFFFVVNGKWNKGLIIHLITPVSKYAVIS